MQYGIRLHEEDNMSWSEFCTLLRGIMPKTPLGQIVIIRSEEDAETLKKFNKEQHKIRNEWRNRNNPIAELTDAQKAEKVKEAQEIFANFFA